VPKSYFSAAAPVPSAGGHNSTLKYCNSRLKDVIGIRDSARQRARFDPSKRAKESTMNRRSILSLVAITAWGLAVLPGLAVAQQKTLKEQLVGVWTLVSNDTTPQTGPKQQVFGANPKGILILDSGGRYALVQGSPDRPKFKNTNNLRLGATAEEFAAAARSFAANFGTWSVNEGDKNLIRKYELALIPNNDALESKVSVSLAGDELKLVGTGANGDRTDTVYRRAK
jgi:hypothetical protein